MRPVYKYFYFFGENFYCKGKQIKFSFLYVYFLFIFYRAHIMLMVLWYHLSNAKIFASKRRRNRFKLLFHF